MPPGGFWKHKANELNECFIVRIGTLFVDVNGEQFNKGGAYCYFPTGIFQHIFEGKPSVEAQMPPHLIYGTLVNYSP